MISVRHQDDSWVYRLLGEQQFQSRKGFLPWWYRLTSPPEITKPTLKQRDLARRSKILSALALFLGLTMIMVAYVALTGPNKQIITTVYTIYATLLICLILNRLGYIHVAGILLTGSLIGGMYFTLIMTALHGGLSPNDKDILYLPFFGELVAAALLPTYAIFLVAGLNISLSLTVLYYAPHTPAFSAMLTTGASSITFRIVEIHFFVALVCWIMATWTLISVKQANRVAELARLEHDVNLVAQEKIKEKAQLEHSIEQIVQVHMQAANGDLDARVPLTNDNVLWKIAGPLNHLLARYQHVRKDAQERDMLWQVLGRLIQDHPQIAEPAQAYLQEQRVRLSQFSSLPSSQSSWRERRQPNVMEMQ